MQRQHVKVALVTHGEGLNHKRVVRNSIHRLLSVPEM